MLFQANIIRRVSGVDGDGVINGGRSEGLMIASTQLAICTAAESETTGFSPFDERGVASDRIVVGHPVSDMAQKSRLKHIER